MKTNSPSESIGGGKWYGWIYIDPNNDKTVYVPNVSMYRSIDGGKTWGKKGPENIAGSFHVDYHGIWIDPRDSNHLILGSDGGLAVSWDFGATWDVFDHLPLAQYYAIGVDMDEPYNIYGGLQDNGSVKVPSNGPRGVDHPRRLHDGRRRRRHGERASIPRTAAGSTTRRRTARSSASISAPARRGRSGRRRRRAGRPYRFNWTAPIHVSPHNSRTIYIGAQVLLRSVNRGDAWREISPDLTTNDPVKLKGNIEFCTLTVDLRVAGDARRDLDGIGRREGAGDAGRGRHVDRRDGQARGGRRPGRLLRHARVRVAAQGRHRVRDQGRLAPRRLRAVRLPHRRLRRDRGRRSRKGLPEGTVYVVVQDRKNADLLFVGTEMGVFATFDGGKAWLAVRSRACRRTRSCTTC